MPKTTAPLLSFGASGQIGKTQVYASWKGIAYARRYVIPSNPRSDAQVRNRNIWSLLGTMWLYAPTSVADAFNTFALGKPLTGRNKFFSDNQKLFTADPMRDDITGLIVSPGARGGIPATGIAVTPAATQLTVTQTLPSVPAGWTIAANIAVAVPDQDPVDPFGGLIFSNRDTSGDGINVITGLANGTLYVVGAFLEWTRPDGQTAYSVSLSSTGTPAP